MGGTLLSEPSGPKGRNAVWGGQGTVRPLQLCNAEMGALSRAPSDLSASKLSLQSLCDQEIVCSCHTPSTDVIRLPRAHLTHKGVTCSVCSCPEDRSWLLF